MHKHGDQATPRAHSFELRRCNDPDCGPHIIALDRRGVPICDIAMPRKHALSFVQALQDVLYIDAVERS
jgi:hypothetical protein